MDLTKAFEIIQSKLSNWLQELIRLLPNILLATLVFVIGLYLAKRIRKIASTLVGKASHNPTLNNLFASVIHIFFIGITLFTVLSILQLDKAVTSILAGAGIIGLALAFAFQDIASNFISGIFMSVRRPLKVGDVVKVKGYMGTVEEINLRDTILRTFQGQMVIIPNKDVFQNPIENFSMHGKRRIDLSVGVSYGEDLNRVMEVTLGAVKNIEGLSADEKTTMFYQEFGDSSINFVIRLWVDSTDQLAYIRVLSEAIMQIKTSYDEHDIMIPFPIRTLDFGIKGGTTLNEISLNIRNNENGEHAST